MRIYADIGRLLAGNGAAHVIQLAALLVLSKFCSPSEFGSLALVQTLGTIAASVMTLQLHCTIPLKKADRSAKVSVYLTQSAIVLTAILVWPVMIMGQGWVGLSAAFLAVMIGLANTYVAYLTSRGNFAKLTRFLVSRAAMVSVSQLSLAALDVSWALVLGALIGEALASTYLRLMSLGPVRFREFNIRAAMKYARKNSSFSVFGTAQELTSIALFSSPLLAFSWLYSDDHAGQFSMASRLVWAPTTLLSVNLARVLAYRYNLGLPKAFGDIYQRKIIVGGIFVALVGYLVTRSFPGIAVSIIGKNWGLAAQMIPIQIVWAFVFLFAVPLRVLCRNLELQHWQLCIELVVLGMMVVAALSTTSNALLLMWMIVLIAGAQSGMYVLLISRVLGVKKIVESTDGTGRHDERKRA